MKRQKNRVVEFAKEKYGYTDDEIFVISGLGSGMNFNKPGIDKLIRMMIRREFRGAKIVVENIDRLICIAQRFLYVAADETGITTEVMSEDDNSEENLKLFFADCISCLHVKFFFVIRDGPTTALRSNRVNRRFAK